MLPHPRSRTLRDRHGQKQGHAAGARIVAGRKPAPAERKWSGLERVGLLLWTGVGVMIIGFVALFALS